MKKEDVKNLAILSRLELTEEERERYAGQFDDILHYQKIIVALTETDRIMQEINKIDLK